MDMLRSMLLFVLFVLSFFGGMLSFYFYGVYKRFIPDMVFWVPPFLQMAKCRCRDIVDTPYGKILGKSNSFWGMFYYGALLILITAIWLGAPIPSWILLILSTIALGFSIYLLRSLHILNVICRTCYGVHVINMLVFAMSLALSVLFPARF